MNLLNGDKICYVNQLLDKDDRDHEGNCNTHLIWNKLDYPLSCVLSLKDSLLNNLVPNMLPLNTVNFT
jgi:hypothetical protein